MRKLGNLKQREILAATLYELATHMKKWTPKQKRLFNKAIKLVD
jgi:hypothetical protein